MSSIRPLALSVAMVGLVASASPLFAADDKVASFEQASKAPISGRLFLSGCMPTDARTSRTRTARTASRSMSSRKH